MYCKICTFPPEYCEFGGTHKRCREALERDDPVLFAQVYGAKQAEPVSEKQEEVERKVQKQVAKEERRAERDQAAAPQTARVVVARIERSKRKHITLVLGLTAAHTGLELKATAKQFAGRFATGATVSGADEILIQGDVQGEVAEWLRAQLAGKDLVVEEEARKKR